MAEVYKQNRNINHRASNSIFIISCHITYIDVKYIHSLIIFLLYFYFRIFASSIRHVQRIVKQALINLQTEK